MLRMSFNLDAVHAARLTFDQQFDAAIQQAYRHVDLADVDEDDDDAQVYAYDERFHCDRCLVGGIIDIVWPSIDKYIRSLEKLLNYDHENPAEPSI